MNTGCFDHPNKDSHRKYFDKILYIADTIREDKKEKAFALVDSALNAFPDPGIDDIYAIDSFKCVQYAFAKHDYVKSISYADSIIMISKDKLDEIYAERYAGALFAKGDCFRWMGNYAECLQYYVLAQQVVLDYVKNNCMIVQYDMGMANLTYSQGKWVEAARYFIKESADLRLSCNKTGDYECLGNASQSYFDARMYDSTLYYANAAISSIEKEENQFPDKRAHSLYAKAVIYGHMVEVYFIKEEFSKAEDLSKIIIQDAGNVDISFNQSMYVLLAKIYLKQSKNKLAEATLDSLKSSLDNFPSDNYLKIWLDLKSNYFAQNMQLDSAIAYQKKYNTINDSINAREKKFAALDVSKEFENLSLKYSNKVLEKEGKLKTLYLFVSIIVFVIVVTIATLVWHNLNRAKKLNKQVEQQNHELEKALTSLAQSHAENSDIMRVVAHDLKNPISAVQNIMYTLILKEQSETQKELFRSIHASCNNSLVLIKDLLEAKNVEVKKSTELLDIGNLLENCVRSLQSKADEKQQIFKLRTEHVNVEINRYKILWAINNIISNAIKFSVVGSTINIEMIKKEENVLLCIHDEGMEMPEKIKDKLFDIDEDAIIPGTDGEQSYGMGLFVSKKIVEECNGKLWLESNEGKGPAFYIELPMNIQPV